MGKRSWDARVGRRVNTAYRCNGYCSCGGRGSVGQGKTGLTIYTSNPTEDRRYTHVCLFTSSFCHIANSLSTILTAFSGNHQRSARHLHSTLASHSPHTRLVAYLMKSDRPICLDKLHQWNDTEVRIFDFASRPTWMDLALNKGEYAWKAQMAEEVLRDYGGLVLWLDTGDALVGDMRKTWVDIAMRGIWTTPTGGPLST
jgi:hypothetical protein